MATTSKTQTREGAPKVMTGTGEEGYARLQKLVGIIKNPKLRAYTLGKLDGAPEYFKTAPASSSGKYHPEYARGEGGLVRHTIAAVTLGRYLADYEYFGIGETDKDYIVASLILHDIFKYGKEPTVGAYNVSHAEDAALYCSDWVNDKLSTMIRSHMGVFGTSKPGSMSAALVGLADLLSSREDIEVV